MIKIYYKILFNIFKLQPELFNKGGFDFEDYYKKISKGLDKIFREGKEYFAKEFSHNVGEEFLDRCENEFVFRFDKEFNPRLEEKLIVNFNEEYLQMINFKNMDIFDSKITHMFENEIMLTFDEEFIHSFDKNTMRRFEKELFYVSDIQNENIFKKTSKNGLNFTTNSMDGNYNLLSTIILSNYLNVMRRGKRGPMNIGNIYALFYMFYGMVVRRTLVGDVDDFRISI